MDTIQIWELITNRNIHVTLSWIKAHVGHEGNELADTQAKLGAGRETINATTLAPWGSVKTAINESILTEWNIRWNNLPKHDATKYFWKHADKNKSRGILNLCRTDLALLIKAITGQNFLAYHQSKINIDISKFCRLCEESEETFIHLVSHCPRLEETRKEIFIDKTFGQDHTWSIRRLMQFIKLPVITRMLTSKAGVLLKDIIELDHNYTLTSDSD